MEVCPCTDFQTQQNVAVLSKFPLTGVLKAIPGREGDSTELDDVDSEADTGISKGMLVSFDLDGHRLSGLRTSPGEASAVATNRTNNASRKRPS